MSNVSEMKIAANGNVNKIAGSIVKTYEEDRIVELFTIGAGALNQCQKAVIAASMILAGKGVTIYERSSFHVVKVGEEDKTAIKKRLIFSKD